MLNLQQPPQPWQKILADGFNDLDQLCTFLELNPADLNIALPAQTPFALRVTRSYAMCMEKGNPDDPLLRQVLPLAAELVDYPGYSADPVGDLVAHAASGIIHKYHGRALIITTGSCAINCRYCFRRNFPYGEVQLAKSRLNSSFDYIRRHTELTEIILSGGDPLLLNDGRLSELIMHLNAIEHIQRIRIHSRIPIVLPERITPALLNIFMGSPKKVILVVHANHANELSTQVASACQQINLSGITLLNQSVLLKGVNDTVESLCTLSQKLMAVGILPYYLHTLDKAKGTGHFEVSKAIALGLYQQLQTLLPGYLVPKLVSEQAGTAYKVPLHA